MKVLIVIEYFYPHIGGVERVFLELGQNLLKKNYDIAIFTTEQSLKSSDRTIRFIRKLYFGLIRQYDISGLTVYRLNVPQFADRYLFPLFGLPFMFLLFTQVDLVHAANNYTVALPSYIFAKVMRKPVTITIWEIWQRLWYSYYPIPFSFFYWAYETLILNLKFNYFLVPSRFVYNQLNNIDTKSKMVTSLGGKKLSYSYSKGIELRKKYNVKNNFVFLYYGRIGKNKGVDFLMSAFAKVLMKVKNTRLFLFIPQPNKQVTNEVRQLIDRYQIKTFVHLYDAIAENDYDRLSAHLSFADCVVIPDTTAAFGLSVLETSQIGRPMVVSSAGAFKEVAYGKVIFVSPSSVDSLKEGMMKAYQNKFTKIPKKDFNWRKTSALYDKVWQHYA